MVVRHHQHGLREKLAGEADRSEPWARGERRDSGPPVFGHSRFGPSRRGMLCDALLSGLLRRRCLNYTSFGAPARAVVSDFALVRVMLVPRIVMVVRVPRFAALAVRLRMRFSLRATRRSAAAMFAVVVRK